MAASGACSRGPADIFLEGWRLGLKAIAVYREGSKGAEPLAKQEHCWVEECGACE